MPFLSGWMDIPLLSVIHGWLTSVGRLPTRLCTMRAELIGHFKACMTEMYLHIDARMADYIRTHP